MKVIGIYLACEPNAGGMYQYTLTLLNALLKKSDNKYKIIGLCLNSHWIKICDDKNIEVVQIHLNRNYELLIKAINTILPSPKLIRRICFYVHPVSKAIKNNKIDLCIYPSQDACSYLFPHLSIGTIHDLMHRYERSFPESSGGLRYYVREKHYQNMFKYCASIIADSPVGAKQIVDSYKKNQLSNARICILPFIAPYYIYNNHEYPTSQEETVSAQLPNKFFFYPAQFWKHKNHANLLKATKLLRDEGVDVNVVLVGSKKNAFIEVNKYIQDNNLRKNICILDYVSNHNIIELYKRAVALIMPTFYGPTNIPPLEAFALGCPVAISDIYGIPEQVGDAALLFDPNSPEDIAFCMKRLWTENSLREDLITKGGARAALWGEKQFSDSLYKIIDETLT